MQKRKLLTILGAFILSGMTAAAQSYTTLADDVMGDNDGGGNYVPDLKKISYRLNTAKDSIWIKLETFNDMAASDNFGFMIGIDNDLVGTNGTAWLGDNHSMKYDKAIFLSQNGMMEPGVIHGYMGTAPGAPPDLIGSVTKPDNKTIIITTKLATIDSDGDMNLLAGSGFFDLFGNGNTWDEAPNSTTFMKIRKTTTAVHNLPERVSFTLYPNPARNELHWDLSDQVAQPDGFISDPSGKTLLQFSLKSKKLDISKLPAGLYFMRAGETAKAFIKE